MASLGPIIATLERSIRTRKYHRILKEEKKRRKDPQTNCFIDDEAEEEKECSTSFNDETRDDRRKGMKKHAKVHQKPKKTVKHRPPKTLPKAP
jgi:hypothetical protein